MSAKRIRRVFLVLRVLLTALVCKSNREFYDRIAPIYDEVFTSHLVHAEKMLTELLQKYPKDRGVVTVLDLGCGTGALTSRLRTLGFAVIGLDISLDSLRLQKTRDSGVNLVQADLGALPFSDGCAQAALCLGVWRHLDSPEHTMDEVCRLLDQDGCFLVGYFPPKLGGLLTVPGGIVGGILVRIYRALLMPFRYQDSVDLESELRAHRLLTTRFVDVSVIQSGTHSRLLEATRPVTR
jgi:ubiquinone/menaquinone biosynthesis C-methylase UbiE